jgi:hypothetical protein
MPKKLKLDLEGLKVNSFVTSVADGVKGKVKGGAVTLFSECSLPCIESCWGYCPTETCQTDCGSCESCVTCVTCPTCHPTCIIKLC